jgi:hypothetical protein
LTKKEERLLVRINRADHLLRWCIVQDHVDLMEAKGTKDVRQEDWSHVIAPFWKAVIKSISLNLKSAWGLMKSGFSTQCGACAMPSIVRRLEIRKLVDQCCVLIVVLSQSSCFACSLWSSWSAIFDLIVKSPSLCIPE